MGNVRNEEFVVPLKGVPIGPSTARTVGKAIHYFDGETLIYCSTNQTPEVIYGDTFKLEFRRTITPKGEKQCHYLEEFQVVFLKKTFVKSTIESQGISNAKKDAETMIKKYTERISGKSGGKDETYLADDIPEPKFFKNPKMKTLLESQLPFSHKEFYSMYISDESKETQLKMYEMKEATNVEISKWKSNQTYDMRTITTIQPLNTSQGKITTRTQLQQFCQLKNGCLIIGNIYTQLDIQENYSLESRMIIKSISQSESTITFQANVLMKKKKEEKEKDILFRFEKECRDDIKYYEDFYRQKKIKETTKNLIGRVTHSVDQLTFKEKMMALQNLILFFIFLILFGIFLKL